MNIFKKLGTRQDKDITIQLDNAHQIYPVIHSVQDHDE